MNLRSFNIGTRLGAGFGTLLLVAGALLAGVTLTGNLSRQAQVQQANAVGERAELVASLQIELLRSAVAARNMGLQTTVEAVQRDEAAAKKHRATYLAGKQKLDAPDLGADEKALITKLGEIDREMDARFKEAVDLAATFNAEQAAVVITKKIDPLLNQATAELARLIELDKARAAQVAAEADRQVMQTQWAVLAVAAALLVGAVAFAWRLTRSITAPLREAEQAAVRVAAGDLDFQMQVDGKDEAARLLGALQEMRGSLAGVVSGVRQNSESVATASQQIAQGNNDLSMRTEQQASALQQTAASMEELGTAVRHNADNAVEANRLAQGAAEVAVRGGTVVHQVVETMKAINDSSKKIADIIGTIDGIAFQTNILALNAAVEAARAGEQGRGFAVVASEVRSLAQRSAGAAKEIKSLISTSVERVDQGQALVDAAGSTMSEIVTAIQRVTEIVGEISHASTEQSSGVAQVGQAVTQMDQSTQQNAALVEQSAAAAESLQLQARQLVEAVAVFKLGQQHA